MLSKLRKLLGRSDTAPLPTSSIPSGERVYAVGDIHGRLDLFENLIAAIEADDAGRRRSHTTVILLGDLIDRGPDSAAVIERARAWSKTRDVQFIQGNHEEMFLEARQKSDTMRGFLKYGGRETLMSYGIAAETIDVTEHEDLRHLMVAAVPVEDFTFLEGFKKIVRVGDYLFVHAGVRPATPLEHQLGKDCRWIREPFLSHRGDFGAVVIHGHTITEEPEVCSNRVGIDTGAYMHGTLTAIGLEGTERWFLQAHDRIVEETAELV